MDDFLTKPLAIESLRSALQRWVPDATTTTNEPVVAAQAPQEERTGMELIGSDALARIEALERPSTKGLLDRVTRVFVAKSAEQMVSIRGALADGQLAVVADECHLLKASAAYFGAVQLSKLAVDVEAACESGDLAEARRLAGSLYSAHAAAVAELQTVVARRRA